MTKPWYVGFVKNRRIAKPTPGVADLDGSREIYGRDPLPKVGTGSVEYGLAETFILASIQQIRRNYPDKREQLRLFERLRDIAEAAPLKGRNKDAIADILLAIDEIKIDLERGA